MAGYEILNYVGLLGAGMYLTAYSLLQSGFVGGNSTQYVLMNLTAASCVAISLTVAFNAASMVIQCSWIVISIFGLLRMRMLTRGMRFSSEEADFIAAKLVGLPKLQLRKILDKGLWVNGVPGTELTVQGAPVANLIYLHSGSADVVMNEQTVATCPQGSFIGEMTVLTGEPATATVRLNTPARYLLLDAAALRKLAGREQSVAMALEVSFARDLRGKLMAANALPNSMRSA